jgi:cysteine desulfurase / selenocysteine lyase
VIYLDNAATTHPKPPAVYERVQHALAQVGASPGRGAYRLAREASSIVTRARATLARFFNIRDPDQVVFTAGATESINVVLKGWLRPGDRVLISSMEHNAVLRPLRSLADKGVQVEMVGCGAGGRLNLDQLQSRLHPAPRLVVLVHASNVNGTLQPIADAARLCREQHVPLLLDAAQTAGIQPIDVEAWQLGMLACSGHKGLFGPPGLGVLYIRPDLDVAPLLHGGTGSRSEEEAQPDFRPDRYECGTLNLPGIAGLAAGVEFIEQAGQDAILNHELAMARRIESGLETLPGVRIQRPEVRGTGVVSFTVAGLNPGDLGHLLDAGFDIAVRAGLHCAPLAHKTLGTFPEGTVRVSAGYFTTPDAIDTFLAALHSLLSRRNPRH